MGKHFSLYFERRKEGERIFKIVREIEEFYNSVKLSQKPHDSVEIFYKKYKEFIMENENRKIFKKIKNLIFRLEELFLKH